MAPRLNIPPATRVLLVVLVLQSCLGLAVRYPQWAGSTDVAAVAPYLTLIPQLSIFYPWVFLTTTLVENNVFTLGISALAIYHGGRYLERAWGSLEFVKFAVVVSLIPNTLTFATMVVFFALTTDIHWTLNPIVGGIPLQISFLVAFSQLIPAHTVTLFRGILSLRVPRFPLLYVLLIAFLSLTPFLSASSFFLAVFGFLVSWTYLRFYKTAFPDLDISQPAGLRGDASETFAFAEFFPDAAKGPVTSISAAVYDVFVMLRICAPSPAGDTPASRGDSLTHRGIPGSTRAETERRRALALKALDQRLHAATAGSSSPATKTPQPSSTIVTDVTAQPKPSPQTDMTSQTLNMLGETNYVPDREGDSEKGSNAQI